MTNTKKVSKIILVICLLVCSLAVPASARSSKDFTFSFPSQFVGSLQSTGPDEASGITPYVTTKYTTIPTYYYLSPAENTGLLATTRVKISTYTTEYFTWQSGYGGTSGTYRLCAYPDPNNGSWQSYFASGSWDC